MPADLRLVILVILVILAAVSAGFGDDGEFETVWPAVLVVTAPDSPDEGPLFQKVIEEAVLLELERQGLRGWPPEASDRRLLAESGGAAGAAPRLFEAAEERGIELVLAGTYGIAGGRIRIEFHWLDVQNRTRAEAVSREFPVDLALDALIREVVAGIVAEHQERILSLRRQVPVTPTEDAAEGTDGADGERAGSDADAEAQADAGTGETAGIVPPSRGAEEVRAAVQPLEVSVGVSPFIATGEVSDYFKLGLMPSFYGCYRFGLPGGVLGVGLFAGFNSFRAVGLLAESQSFLLPVGADLRYWFGFGRGMAVTLFVRLTAGPALFSVNVEGTGILRKIVIFTMGGIGFNVPFTEGLGLNVETSYGVFFDRPDPIMGFVPAVGVYARF